MATQIGPKIGIEGEKEYRAQIQQIIQQTKNLDAAMNRTASEWDDNTSAMTKNKAVAQNLVQQINLQKEKLALYNQMLDQSTEKLGENASSTLKWQNAVDNATASLNHMQQSLDSLHGAEGFSEISTKMADFGTKMQGIGANMQALGQRLTTSLTLPIAAVGAASVKLASDTEEARNKVDVVFGSMSEKVKEFASTALNSLGLAEGTALQMAGTFGAMATSMGLSQQEAANMSMSLTSLAADMASFYNVSTDVAEKSLQSVFTGETEALKKFGIVMSQTNLEEFAQQQGKVYSKMSESEKVMTRYAFVMNATKDAQGDFARTSDGAANSFRVFSESLKELGSTLGESILPIVTPIIQAITSLVQKFASLPAPIQKAIVVLALIVAAVGPLIMIFGSLISTIGSLITVLPALTAALAGASAGLAAFSAAAGPVILVILAVAAAIALAIGVGVLIGENWDTISAKASELGESISSAYQAIMAKNEELKNSVNGFVVDIAQGFASLPGKVIQALQDAAQKVKDTFDAMIQNAKQSGRDFIQGFVDGIKEKLNKVVKVVKDVANTIKDYLGFSCPDKGPLHEYETWMPDMMMGLAKGIYQNMGLVTNAMQTVSKNMALPMSDNAQMNMAFASAGADGMSSYIGGTTMNVYVDHINDLNDLLRIQSQAQQRFRMGAK